MKTLPIAIVVSGSLFIACSDQPVTAYELPTPPSSSSGKAPSAASAPNVTSPTPTIAPTTTASPPPTPPTTPTVSPTVPPPAPTQTPTPNKPDEPPAVTAATLVPLYSHVNLTTGDWILSRVLGEGAPSYKFTRINYRILETASVPNVLPLFRCIDANGSHFQSNLTNCEKVGTFDGQLGFVYASNPGGGARVIKRCIGSSGSPIVTTTDPANECPGLVVQAGEFGYAFAP